MRLLGSLLMLGSLLLCSVRSFGAKFAAAAIEHLTFSAVGPARPLNETPRSIFESRRLGLA